MTNQSDGVVSTSGAISVSSSAKNRSPKALIVPQTKSQQRRVSGGEVGSSRQRLGETEEDDPGEIGELGEEIVRNDMTDLPIEKPKCLSNINMGRGETNFQDTSESPHNSLFTDPQIINQSTMSYQQQASAVNDEKSFL